MKVNILVPEPRLNMYKFSGIRIPQIGPVYLGTILKVVFLPLKITPVKLQVLKTYANKPLEELELAEYLRQLPQWLRENLNYGMKKSEKLKWKGVKNEPGFPGKTQAGS